MVTFTKDSVLLNRTPLSYIIVEYLDTETDRLTDWQKEKERKRKRERKKERERERMREREKDRVALTVLSGQIELNLMRTRRRKSPFVKRCSSLDTKGKCLAHQTPFNINAEYWD